MNMHNKMLVKVTEDEMVHKDLEKMMVGICLQVFFKGSGDIDNLVPMDSNLNRGEWKKMENAWANAVYNKDGIGRKVEVKITPIYMDSSQCPTKFIVKYRVDSDDSKAWRIKIFDNEKEGKK